MRGKRKKKNNSAQVVAPTAGADKELVEGVDTRLLPNKFVPKSELKILEQFSGGKSVQVRTCFVWLCCYVVMDDDKHDNPPSLMVKSRKYGLFYGRVAREVSCS